MYCLYVVHQLLDVAEIPIEQHLHDGSHKPKYLDWQNLQDVAFQLETQENRQFSSCYIFRDIAV